MKFNLIVLLLTTVLFACNSNTKKANKQTGESITITGKIKNPQKGIIYLEKFEDSGFVLIDSMALAGETFQLNVAVNETDIYKLNFLGRAEIPLVLNPKEKDIQIEIDAKNDVVTYEIKGSKESNYYLIVNQAFAQFRSDAEALMQAREQAKDEKSAQAIEEKYIQMQKDAVKQVKALIDTIQPSIVALVASNGLDPNEQYEYLQKLATDFKKHSPNSKYTKRFVNQLAQIEEQRQKIAHLAVGKIAPDIDLENPKGEKIKLSSLKGKLVLIDFWASWCKPCRAENPNVVKVYEKYKNKGFEIYGVSLDNDKDAWLKAIQKDQISWLQVSDLKFWQSEAAQTYQIQAIPATYLLDKEGKILAKDLRGLALEEKIKEVLN